MLSTACCLIHQWVGLLTTTPRCRYRIPVAYAFVDEGLDDPRHGLKGDVVLAIPAGQVGSCVLKQIYVTGSSPKQIYCQLLQQGSTHAKHPLLSPQFTSRQAHAHAVPT